MPVQPFNLQKNLIINASGNMMCIDARQPFTIKINTIYGNGNNTFALPLTNHTTNLKIETSDGQSISITNYTDTAKLISFPSAGVYTIKMRGECGWSFNNSGDCQKLIGVSSWGESKLKFNYLANGFRGCINIGLNEGLPIGGSIDAPLITDLSNIFRSCNLYSVGSPYILTKCINATNGLAIFHTNNLTTIPVELLHGMRMLNNLFAAFYNNKIESIPYGLLFKNQQLVDANFMFSTNRLTTIPNDLLRYCPMITGVHQIFYSNLISSLPENIFYYNPKIVTYSGVFKDALVAGCMLPTIIFNLSNILKVTTFSELFYKTNSSTSPIGTVQDIWNYASPTAIKTDCFQNCTGLANYLDIPVDWI